jgi:hypothetical protein
MRSWFFELTAALLLAGSLYFFYRCMVSLSDRDYVGSILLMFVGLAVLRVGADLARLSLVARR